MIAGDNQDMGALVRGDAQHSPTPWRLQPGFLTIYNLSDGNAGLTCAIAKVIREQSGDAAAAANAALIVRAVNSHAQLVAALKAVMHQIDSGNMEFDDDWANGEIGAALDEARAALAAARGTP